MAIIHVTACFSYSGKQHFIAGNRMKLRHLYGKGDHRRRGASDKRNKSGEMAFSFAYAEFQHTNPGILKTILKCLLNNI
jgi:hypothetical protein